MAVRIEKIIATVLHEAHDRQVEEVMESLSEGPEGFYRSPPDCELGCDDHLLLTSSSSCSNLRNRPDNVRSRPLASLNAVLTLTLTSPRSIMPT